MFREAVDEYGLEADVTLAGSFCTGRCNREGVTVSIDDDVYTGVTPSGFKEFFDEKILKVVKNDADQ